ncbi:MAG: SPASM domain-containing protein, partial [Candidatus Omnitrophica bacterium]|nr:SPASM domain-containing protein [Candidatus Omnitrophota bacterium]
IRSDGKVVPCSAFWTLVCGDARKDSLRDIWRDSEVLNTIRGLADIRLDKCNKKCAKCDYLSYCNGGCRAAAYYSSGMDLKGIEERTCIAFSNLYGFRVEESFVFPKKKVRGTKNGKGKS